MKLQDIIAKNTHYNAKEVINKLNDRTFIESLITSIS